MVSLRRICLAVVTLSAVLLCASTPAAAYPQGQTGSAPPVLGSGPLSGVIRAPDGYATPAAPVPESTGTVAATGGLRAVAVVGDVGSVTATYKQDMDSAVTALEAHGVTVTRFTYGEGSFTWADIVAAAQGCTLPAVYGPWRLLGWHVHQPHECRGLLPGTRAVCVTRCSLHRPCGATG